MDDAIDFPKDGLLPGVIFYDNKMDDSSTAAPDVFSGNDSNGNTNSCVLITHDTLLYSDSVQDWVHQMQLLSSQESFSRQESTALNN